MQLVKQQYMEENSRLRATLEEWSHRNAKLEQKLNHTNQKLQRLTAPSSSAEKPSDS